MVLTGYCHSLDIQHNFTRIHRCFVYFKADISSYHHGGKFFWSCVFDVDGVNVFSFAEDGAAVSYFHDLVQFVCDKENAFSFCCKAFHDLHELCDFLYGKHGSRLVEDQDFVITVEHLQDFGSLLHSDCDVLDQSIRIYLEMIFLRQLHDFLSGVVFFQQAVFGVFYSEDDVIQYGEAFHQFEVLVYHTDLQGIGIVWILDLYFLSVFAYLAFIRLVQTKQNTHQR